MKLSCHANGNDEFIVDSKEVKSDWKQKDLNLKVTVLTTASLWHNLMGLTKYDFKGFKNNIDTKLQPHTIFTCSFLYFYCSIKNINQFIEVALYSLFR